MPTGSTTSTVVITFDDGLYSYADMTRFIQRKLEQAGAYLIDSDGNYRHYFQISENAVYYSAQVDLSPVPTTLPSGWTRPSTGLYSAGGSGLPTTTRVPILSITNSAFGSLIGFAVGSFPSSAQTSAQTFLGTTAPTISPVSSFIVRCNLVDNPYAVPADILTMFDTKSTQAGQLISFTPNEYSWIPIKDGSYASIRLTIVDQYERPVKIRDPNISIVLAFRPRR
ncbi:unnamed protein product [Phytophthora lilii]|uniref:Unnamed protein product n=1 Tax=Phytophthora lilii TaxID=2077276 RepID=A0A9W7CUE5_9STRA|nr:unnamed protein product [Phytophthora lilii]